MTDHSLIQKSLDWAWHQANSKNMVFSSSVELAEQYLKNSNNDIEAAISEIINWQIVKAGTAGFVTGLGGIITIPITLPANLVSVLYIQLRMIAAIAHLRGYSIDDDQVKTFAFLSLTGSSALDITKKIGISFGEKISQQIIGSISTKAIFEINKKLGFRMFTKFGEKGLINFASLIPIIGGVINSGFDSTYTKIIGETAKQVFVKIEKQEGENDKKLLESSTTTD